MQQKLECQSVGHVQTTVEIKLWPTFRRALKTTGKCDTCGCALGYPRIVKILDPLTYHRNLLGLNLVRSPIMPELPKPLALTDQDARWMETPKVSPEKQV